MTTAPPSAPIGPSTFVGEHDALSITAWQGPVGTGIRGSMSILFDNEEDLTALAVKARFPSLAPPDAIQWITADRMIDAGPNELASHVALRAIRWLDMARYFGTPIGVMYSILGYLSPLLPKVSLVNQNARWYSYAAGTDPWPSGQAFPTAPDVTTFAVTPTPYWNWDKDADPWYGAAAWWRSWVIVQSPSGSPWAAPSATFGGGASFGDGTAINWSGPPADAQMLRNLTRKFKSAHTYVPTIIVTYLSTIFNETGGTPGTNLPDGKWGHWSKVAASGGYPSVYVPARNVANASYIDGTA